MARTSLEATRRPSASLPLWQSTHAFDTLRHFPGTVLSVSQSVSPVWTQLSQESAQHHQEGHSLSKQRHLGSCNRLPLHSLLTSPTLELSKTRLIRLEASRVAWSTVRLVPSHPKSAPAQYSRSTPSAQRVVFHRHRLFDKQQGGNQPQPAATLQQPASQAGLVLLPT